MTGVDKEFFKNFKKEQAKLSKEERFKQFKEADKRQAQLAKEDEDATMDILGKKRK